MSGARPHSRREFLQRLAAGASAVSLVSAAPSASAGRRKVSKVRDIKRGRRGTTIWLDLERAPFPHPAYPDWTDPTVIVFVPKHFRVHRDMDVDTVMHFHGHRDTAERAMKRHQLREQLYDSKQNAILVVPQGPVKANSSRFGKLDEPKGLLRLLTEVRRELQTPRLQAALGPSGVPRRARIGKLILSAHSGGYRAAAMCCQHGGYDVREVWLFDALYSHVEVFRDWVLERRRQRGAKRHKLVSYYSGPKLTQNNRELMAALSKRGVRVLHEEREGELTRDQLTNGRAVFVKSTVSHQGMIYKRNAFRDCLFASCLTRYLKADWFRHGDKPRELDKRGG